MFHGNFADESHQLNDSIGKRVTNMGRKAREIGIPFENKTGKYNAITDVAGVEVGFCSVIEGESTPDTTPDSEFARTGVTCILPRGHRRSAVFAGRADLNGNGELTGTHWVDDSGYLHGPVCITNTNSVGIVRDTVSKWMLDNDYFYPMLTADGREVPGYGFFYPVVAETFDGFLNNINGFRVRPEHVLTALDSAASGEVAEGNVGGGVGMCCHGFKGGTGTASRIVTTAAGEFTVGVLVQANHGRRDELNVCGIPMGIEIEGCYSTTGRLAPKEGDGSMIAVIATDAPVLPWQLSKLARRAGLGINRIGAGNGSYSGDIFIAFSTANENAFNDISSEVTLLGDAQLDPLFRAVTEATAESIMNALLNAEDTAGRNGNTQYALPHDQVRKVLEKYKTYLDSAWRGKGRM